MLRLDAHPLPVVALAFMQGRSTRELETAAGYFVLAVVAIVVALLTFAVRRLIRRRRTPRDDDAAR